MTTGFFPRYSQLGASSRCRFYMYFQRWQKLENNADIAIYPGFSDKYLRKLYKDGAVGKFVQCKEFLSMLFRAMRLPEKLIIEYELVPWLPYKYEKLLLGKRPYILNFDDNVWEKYRNIPGLQDKYDRLCAGAAGVIVANEFLYNKVVRLNENVCLVPTVVDLDKYDAVAAEKFDVFTAAWIGTPVTYKYLEEYQDILQSVFNSPDRKLLVIADKQLGEKRPLKHVNAEYVSWSDSSECEYIKRCHVGIMPLTDDEFSRGKSSYKLLQYQAAGLPLIASPVGENKRVVLPGYNGFLAADKTQWLQAFADLEQNSAVYERCCNGARQQAYEYSIQKYFPLYRDFINKTFS